jgi:maltodextrin utilization protein YvdJ
MNNNAFMTAELETIFSYPIQSLCFVIAGILLLSGLGLLLSTTAHDKWRNRAEALIFSGSLIAIPIIIPLIITFIGFNILSYPTVHTAVSLLYLAVPFICAITGYLAWVGAGNETNGKNND